MAIHAHVYPNEVSQNNQDPIDASQAVAYFTVWTYGGSTYEETLTISSHVSVPVSSSAAQITRACVAAAIALLASDHGLTVAEHNIITTPLAQ